ncbi:MAG: preprotein translocase subunit YajC [Opitutales bacterium]
MNTLIFLAQAAPGQGAPNPLLQFMPMIVIFAAMYFLMIAPQRKKQKEHQQMLTELKVGDKVITNAGIYGAITSVKDDRFVIQIAEATKIEIAKQSIQSKNNS